MIHNLVENALRSLWSGNSESLTKPELCQDMQARDMIEMMMTQEQMDCFVLMNMLIQLEDTVTRIKDDRMFCCSYEDTDRVPHCRIEPTIRAEKYHFHKESRGKRFSDRIGHVRELLLPESGIHTNPE